MLHQEFALHGVYVWSVRRFWTTTEGTLIPEHEHDMKYELKSNPIPLIM